MSMDLFLVVIAVPLRAGVLLRFPAGVRVQAGGQRGAAVRGVPVVGVGGLGTS